MVLLFFCPKFGVLDDEKAGEPPLWAARRPD
jgi:hypothetical protein